MGETALIMAGGRGLRMAASGAALPKPLVEVAGVALVEHNLNQLARHGFDRIVVAAPAEEPRIADFVQGRLSRNAQRLGINVELLLEEVPLGNAGAARLLINRGDVLMVYADNLTALDLRALMDRHRLSRAAMTVTVHSQPFRMPFGEVQLEGDRLVSYVEKPTHTFLICSAVCAMTPEAIAAIAPGEAIGLSDLVRRLVARGANVIAYQHNAPWIDVNDLGAVVDAEAMLRAHEEKFAFPKL